MIPCTVSWKHSLSTADPRSGCREHPFHGPSNIPNNSWRLFILLIVSLSFLFVFAIISFIVAICTIAIAVLIAVSRGGYRCGDGWRYTGSFGGRHARWWWRWEERCSLWLRPESFGSWGSLGRCRWTRRRWRRNRSLFVITVSSLKRP